MKLSLPEVAASLGAEGNYEPDAVAVGYSIDSRTVAPEELFFAIAGERFDGHDFVQDVLAKRAYAVIAESRATEFAGLHGVMVVENPLVALQRLGQYVRRKWGKRVIGLTGSAGKTTTKDATAAVLATRFTALKSLGNLNNHIGVPLQLLRLEAEHEVAVIEMGMNHAREIAFLCEIAEPDWAIVTNVGTAHAGNFPDGIEGVRKAKYELIEGTKPGGTLILNGDDERVRYFRREYQGRALYYGVSAGMDVWAERIEDLGVLGQRFELGCSRALTDEGTVPVELSLVGRHNLMNALAAAATGVAAGIPLADIARALGTLSPGDRRGEVIRLALPEGTAVLINDTYNSNPKALNAMVEALLQVPAKRRIVVAGEMLELGEDAAELHRECGRFIAERRIDLTIGVRGHAAALVHAVCEEGGAGTFVDTPQQAGELLSQELRDGDAVLLKASRGVRLENALEHLQPSHTKSQG